MPEPSSFPAELLTTGGENNSPWQKQSCLLVCSIPRSGPLLFLLSFSRRGTPPCSHTLTAFLRQLPKMLLSKGQYHRLWISNWIWNGSLLPLTPKKFYLAQVNALENSVSLIPVCPAIREKMVTYFDCKVCLGHVPSSFWGSITSTWVKGEIK